LRTGAAMMLALDAAFWLELDNGWSAASPRESAHLLRSVMPVTDNACAL
jgi:hypothetical protein